MPDISYMSFILEPPTRKVSIFRNNRNLAIRLPKDFEFPGMTELAIEKHGDAIVLRPIPLTWTSWPTNLSPTLISYAGGLSSSRKACLVRRRCGATTAAYMLDTNICSFIMRERPLAVLQRLQAATERRSAIVISVVTYYEILLETLGRKASPRHAALAEAFVARLSAILPWDREAADQATRVRKDLAAKETPIGGADTMIAGHALAADCVLVTNNVCEFARVRGLRVEDWAAVP